MTCWSDPSSPLGPRTCAIQGKGQPVERVVPPVADVDRDPTKLRFKHRVTSVTLHVVGALIKVTDAGDVVLAVLSDHVSSVADDDRSVPDGS
jgi:hypothetical protein